MIHVVVDDLAFVPADALVRPATADLEPTVAALRRLEQIGGPTFWKQLTVQSGLDVGAAVVTTGGELSAEFVIHAVISSPSEPVSAGGVRRALRSVLQRAADWGLKRVAIPPLGTGPGNLPLEDVAALMVDMLLTEGSLLGFPEDVTIVVETDEQRAVFEACLGSRLQ